MDYVFPVPIYSHVGLNSGVKVVDYFYAIIVENSVMLEIR